MKELDARNDAEPETTSGQGAEATATPEAIDQPAKGPEPSGVIGQTVRESAPAEEIAQADHAPTPPQSVGETAVRTPQPESIDHAPDATTPLASPGAGTRGEAAAPEPPFVLMTSEERSRVIAAPAPQAVGECLPEQAQVHIAPNLLDLATGRVDTAAEKEEARERRDLDRVVHNVLIVGLAISTLLLLIGLGLEIIRRQDLPTVEPDFSQVFARVVALRPSGFLALGLLVLIATPVLRVISSIFAFAYERDWRFAGITFLVLMVLVLSTLLGKG